MLGNLKMEIFWLVWFNMFYLGNEKTVPIKIISRKIMDKNIFLLGFNREWNWRSLRLRWDYIFFKSEQITLPFFFFIHFQVCFELLLLEFHFHRSAETCTRNLAPFSETFADRSRIIISGFLGCSSIASLVENLSEKWMRYRSEVAKI